MDQFSAMHSVLLPATDYYVLKRTDGPLLLLRQEGMLELLFEYVEFWPFLFCLFRDFSEKIRKILHLDVVRKVKETVVQDRGIEKKGKINVEPQSHQWADFSFAVDRYIFGQMVSDELDDCLQVVHHGCKVVSASGQEMR